MQIKDTNCPARQSCLALTLAFLSLPVPPSTPPDWLFPLFLHVWRMLQLACPAFLRALPGMFFPRPLRCALCHLRPSLSSHLGGSLAPISLCTSLSPPVCTLSVCVWSHSVAYPAEHILFPFGNRGRFSHYLQGLMLLCIGSEQA